MSKQLKAIAVAASITLAAAATSQAASNGVIKVKSDYSLEQTVERIKQDVASKKIMLFDVIDQAKLAKEAGIDLKPSTLIIFGNPPLGTQFIEAKPEAGLDWPVRLLVYTDTNGQVWMAYTDFDWIAKRHGIENRDEQFETAGKVVKSITNSAHKE